MDNKGKLFHTLQNVKIYDLPICVYSTTLDGEFVEVSEMGRELLGLGDGSLEKQPIKSLYKDLEERKRLIEITLQLE